METTAPITPRCGYDYEIRPLPDAAPEHDGVFLDATGRPLLGTVIGRDDAWPWIALSNPLAVAPADWATHIVRELPGLPF